MPNDVTGMLAGTPGAPGAPPAAAPGGTPGAPGAPPAAPPPAAGAFQWSPTLAPEVKSLLEAKAFDKDPNALAVSYFNANKALSGAQDVLVIPADGNLDPVYDKLGRPKTPQEYGDWKFKDGIAVDDKFKEFGKSFFHKLGVPAAKSQAAIDMWQDFVATRAAEMQTESKAANEASLRSLEVAAGGTDKFNTLVANGKKAFAALGLPNDVVSKIEANIGAAPLLQLFGTLGAKMGGESSVIGNGAGSGGVIPVEQMTLQQAEARTKELESDVEFMKAYNDKNAPKHNDNVKILLDLADTIVKRRKGL